MRHVSTAASTILLVGCNLSFRDVGDDDTEAAFEPKSPASQADRPGSIIGTLPTDPDFGPSTNPNPGAAPSAPSPQAPSPSAGPTDPAYEPNVPRDRSCVESLLASAAGDAGLADSVDDADPTAGLTPELDLGTGDLTVLVVFDKSGSMSDHWDGRTKWEVANEALMAGLDGIFESITIGSIFFPVPNDCAVAPLDSELQFGFSNGTQFYDRWVASEQTRFPQGSTPLEAAFATADVAIEDACRQGLLDDRFRVILVTDGMPTCSDDVQWVVDLAAEWAEIGVDTHVLGLPGSESAAALLNAIATGGGTVEYQAQESPDELDGTVYHLLR